MHVDEQETDASLVRRLLAAQFPMWADLPVEPVPSAGTDNALYRLGRDKVVRLPRVHWATGQVDKEQEWLPRLGPLLPLAVPVPLGKGRRAGTIGREADGVLTLATPSRAGCFLRHSRRRFCAGSEPSPITL